MKTKVKDPMELRIVKPRKALNKAFLKLKPNRSSIETFKSNLVDLLNLSNTSESEEFHKNLVAAFLNRTYYHPNFFINTKGRNDLVIYNGKDTKSKVGVIIEAKKPTNKSEMLSCNNINTKAFHELILYYLRERITEKNLDLKHIVATNINEWFIFEANEFERLFASNKNFVKHFLDFEEGRLSGKNTEFFYSQIAKPFVDSIKSEISFTYFDIRDYEKPLRNESKTDDTKLISIYKLFSPEHLLKLPFANDSNSLDKRFYSELLHIIGLTETKEGNKKLITRKAEKDRDYGSILENTIIQLDSLDKLSRIENIKQYGHTSDERLFSVALELSITWINRILFLKLLEAQLLKYHQGNKEYSFLNLERIRNFDDLNTLFFQVLAKKHDDRNNKVKDLFEKVPYLNSSLFEPNELEHAAIFISNLSDDDKIPIIAGTVLKDNSGKKRSGQITTLQYLFEFLDAYDFSSEGSEDIQEENKTLINASVLGLIFEKINGYKDGSFFTPGFITMYMSRETIRRAVLQKFNEIKAWECETLDDLYDKIEDRTEANIIVNSLKICDPAVGSGHFLVSALNEIITIKNDLKILQDRDGKRLKEYHIEVVNDELIVTDEDGELFEYNPKSKESQRIQETLFHEKQTIIENCLFGVDINPNSVKICRLRLWIELLKNAYYTKNGRDCPELQTLPNIDINIKCGNSLISRFSIDADLKQALKKSRWSIDMYRVAVQTYRNAVSKEQKHEMEKLIKTIKSDFRTEIAANSKELKDLNKWKGELFGLTNQSTLFELTQKQKKEFNLKVATLTKKIKNQEILIEEIKNNQIYENAFEWRFEFPEVLNDDGDFIGFDVVIGNPPYIRQEEIKEMKSYLSQNYKVYNSIADILTYFVELGYNVLKNKGHFQFIISNKFTRANYGKELRNFLQANTQLTHFVDFSGIPVFDEATVDAAIVGYAKTVVKENTFTFIKFDKSVFDSENFENLIINLEQKINQNLLLNNTWSFENEDILKIKEKVSSQGISLTDWDVKINYGIKTGFNEAFVIDSKKREGLIEIDPNSNNFIKPLLRGKDIQKFSADFKDLWLIYIPKGYTIKAILGENNNEVNEPIPRYGYVEYDEAWVWFAKQLPAIANHLLRYKDMAIKRSDIGDYWWELRACAYLEDFEKPKVIFMEMTKFFNFSYDSDDKYYALKTCWILTGKHIEYLCCLFNSRLFYVLFKDNFPELLGGTRLLNKLFFEQLEIKQIDDDTNSKFAEILRKIQSNSDNKKLYTQLVFRIDKLIYELYGLTEEEIGIVEESFKNK